MNGFTTNSVAPTRAGPGLAPRQRVAHRNNPMPPARITPAIKSLLGTWGDSSPRMRTRVSKGTVALTSPSLGRGAQDGQGACGPAGASSRRRYPGLAKGPRTAPATRANQPTAGPSAAGPPPLVAPWPGRGGPVG